MWNMFGRRARLIKGLSRVPWVRWVVLLWLFLSIYDTIGAQLVPAKLEERMPRLYEIIEMSGGFLPVWAWALIAMAIITIASIEYAVRLTPKVLEYPLPKFFRRRKVERDMPVGPALQYLLTHRWSDKPMDFRYHGSFADSPLKISQAGVDGKITIWGKHNGAPPYVIIPKEFWVKNTLSYDSYIAENKQGFIWARSQTTPRRNIVEGDTYTDLMVSRAEFEKIDWNTVHGKFLE